MANMFDMVKQAASMKKKMKQIQKELKKQTVEASSGSVKVTVCCDMSLSSLKIDSDRIDPSDVERIEKSVVLAVNDALESAKKKAAREMSNLAGGLGGLADMLG